MFRLSEKELGTIINKIMGVAILKDNTIWSKYQCRHYELFTPENKGGIQGFVDARGKFYTREEAEKFAREIGQMVGKNIGGPLTSEDLW